MCRRAMTSSGAAMSSGAARAARPQLVHGVVRWRTAAAWQHGLRQTRRRPLGVWPARPRPRPFFITDVMTACVC